MARPLKSQQQETRHRALVAADALLHERGYLGLSMDEVAKMVGIRKPSLYHYFPEGKDQMLLEVMEDLIAKDALGIEAAIAGGSTVRQKLEAIANYVFMQQRQTDRVLSQSAPFLPKDHQATIFQMFFAKHYQPIQAVFLEGIKHKHLRLHDTERSTWAFLGLISEMNALMLSGQQRNQTEMATWLVGVLIDGLHS
jgi:AcrR family transcriptional regulator